MKHGKIFKVIIRVADGGIKDHLPEQRIRVFPGIAAEFIDYRKDIRIRQVVISVSIQQSLHADHVIAAAGRCYIKPFHKQDCSIAGFLDQKIGNVQTRFVSQTQGN